DRPGSVRVHRPGVGRAGEDVHPWFRSTPVAEEGIAGGCGSLARRGPGSVRRSGRGQPFETEFPEPSSSTSGDPSSQDTVLSEPSISICSWIVVISTSLPFPSISRPRTVSMVTRLSEPSISRSWASSAVRSAPSTSMSMSSQSPVTVTWAAASMWTSPPPSQTMEVSAASVTRWSSSPEIITSPPSPSWVSGEDGSADSVPERLDPGCTESGPAAPSSPAPQPETRNANAPMTAAALRVCITFLSPLQRGATRRGTHFPRRAHSGREHPGSLSQHGGTGDEEEDRRAETDSTLGELLAQDRADRDRDRVGCDH